MFKFLKLSLILHFFSATSYSQKSEQYIIHSNGGLCSSSINLANNGTYNFESGCEASSHISFGTWVQKKDTIAFTQFDRKNFKVVKNVSASTTTEKILSVKLFDQNGKNITEIIRIGQYVKGKGIYSMTLDSTKTKRTDFIRDNGIIILTSLQNLFQQNLEIKVDGSNNYEITLNVFSDWFYNINSVWLETGSFKLLKTKDALISFNRDFVDDKGNLTKMKYVKELN